MNAFALLDHIVDDYAAYTRSFLKIRDEDIKDFVDGELESGALWPDALVQLNPAYEAGYKPAGRGAACGERAGLCRVAIGLEPTKYRLGSG